MTGGGWVGLCGLQVGGKGMLGQELLEEERVEGGLEEGGEAEGVDMTLVGVGVV